MRINRLSRAPVSKGSLGDTQNPSTQFINLMNGGPTISGEAVNADTAMRISAVYACVRVIAEDIAKLGLTVWIEKPDGGRREFTEHPLHAVLKRPHRLMTQYRFMAAMGASLGFRGNGIAVKLRDGRGQPTGLWPVHPGSVTIFETTSSRLFYGVSRRNQLDMAVLAGLPELIPDYDIVHLRGVSFDGIVGLSPLAQLREDIGIALAGRRLAGSWLKNGAEVGTVLKHPSKLSDQAVMDRLKASWNSRNAGPDNAGGTVILEEGMTLEKLGMTSVDLEFIAQRKLTIEEIARGFRVPLHMIGVLDKMTNNNVAALTRAYYDQALMPLLETIENELNDSFDLPDGAYVEFDVDRILRADFKARQEGNRIQYAAGALKPNEWRIDEGRDPSPAGEVFARPLNTAYVDPDGKVIAITPAGGKDTGAEEEPAGPDAGAEAETDEKPTEDEE